MAKQPHIIFILSDQHNSKIMGNAGDTFIKTPNLDRLAENGTSLLNCYCASPLCVPSRSSMLSGLLPTKTGVYNNMQSLNSCKATFVNALVNAGYHSVLCGRMHFNGPDQRHGFEERLVGDITPSFPGRKNTAYCGTLDGTSGQNKRAIKQSGSGYSSVLAYDIDVINEACDYLDTYENEQPLFMTVGLYGPHCPYVCPKELFDYYMEILPEPNGTKKEFRDRVHPAVNKWYKNRGVEDITSEDIRRVRAAYYGMITFMDVLIGDLLDKIENNLALEDTIIIYASDHGDNAGHNGLFWKTNMYDGAAKVPAIFSWKNTIPKGTEVEGLTSLLDIGSTLINIAGGEQLPKTNGRNITQVLLGKEEIEADRAVIAQCVDLKGDNPSAMIRKGEWKLVSHYGYEDIQLFHTKDDPDEINDKGKDDRYQRIKANLLNELNQYWDGDRVYQQLQEDIKHAEIIRKWAQKSHVQGIEEWFEHTKTENNYLD